jgi:hypothetical protein
MGDHSALHTTSGSSETSQSRSGTMVLQQSPFIEKSIEIVPVISPDGFVDSSTLADATQACSKEGPKKFESWIRFIIKHSSRFQKVSQVVPVINRNTHLILPSRFCPIFLRRSTSPHLKSLYMSRVPHMRDNSTYPMTSHSITSNTCGIYATSDAEKLYKKIT